MSSVASPSSARKPSCWAIQWGRWTKVLLISPTFSSRGGAGGAVAAGCAAAAAPVVQQGVDLILWNGKVVTVDPAFSLQEAIAISNGRIVNVGRDDEIRRLV